MNFRNFGETGPSVSEIGLGCWQLGGDWGDVDDYTAQKVLEAAVQNGINFYDTADVYGEGRSEEGHAPVAAEREGGGVCFKFGEQFKERNPRIHHLSGRSRPKEG